MSINFQDIQQRISELQYRRYPGAEKEKWILREILTVIGVPSRLMGENELQKTLLQATKKDIQAVPEGVFLSFYHEGAKLARLDLSDANMQGKILSNKLKPDQVEEILDVGRQFIREHKGVSTMLPDWIRRFFKGESVQGILPILDTGLEGEWFEISITKENDIHEKIEEVVSHLYHADTVVTKISITLNNGATMEISQNEDLFVEAVQRSASNIYSLEQFMRRLNENYEYLLRERDKEKGNIYKDYTVDIYLPEGTKASIYVEELLLQMRTREDTRRALNRLLSVGFIDNFKEREEDFVFYFTKRNKEEYLGAIVNYLKQYEATEVLKPVVQKIEAHNDIKLVFGDCLNVLIDFIYKHSTPQRKELAGYFFQQLEQNDIRYNDILQLPAKYENTRLQPNLITDTSKGTVCAWDVVWKYIDEVGKSGESTVLNIRELRNSTEELKLVYPQNPVFLLLHAFCVLYLETDVREDKLHMGSKEKVKTGIDDFVEGFIQFKNLYEINSEELKIAVVLFHKKVLQYRSELSYILNQATELLYLELHNRWLRQFNQKFLVGYER